MDIKKKLRILYTKIKFRILRNEYHALRRLIREKERTLRELMNEKESLYNKLVDTKDNLDLLTVV